MSRNYPPIATKLINVADAWLTGSGLYLSMDTIRANPPGQFDLDFFIPAHKWHLAAALIPSDAKPNTFGGWKFMDDGVEIDVWPDMMDGLLMNQKCKKIYKPKEGVQWNKLFDCRDNSK